MPRLLTRNCKATIVDNLSGSEIELFYSLPTTEQRLKFLTLVGRNSGTELNHETIEEIIDLGLEIITGFREGDFMREDQAGEWVPVSTLESSENYYAEWKELMRESAADIIDRFTARIFGNSGEVKGLSQVGK